MKNGMPHKLEIKYRTFLVIITLILNILITTVIGFALYVNTSTLMRENSDFISRTSLSQLSAEIERTYNSIRRVANYIQNDNYLSQLITKINKQNVGMYDKYKGSNEISGILSNISQYDKNIISINLFSYNYEYSSAGLVNDILVQAGTTRKDFLKSKTEENTLMPITTGIIRKFESFRIYEGKTNFIYQSQPRNFEGIVFVVINGDFIKKALPMNGKIIILNRNNDILLKEDSINDKEINDLLSNINDSEKSLNKDQSVYNQKGVFFRTSIQTGWKILYIPDTKMQDMYLDKVRMLFFLLFSLSIFFTLVLTRVTAQLVLKPIIKLTELVKNYKQVHEKKFSDINFNKNMFSLREKIFYCIFISALLPFLFFVLIFYFQSIEYTNQQVLMIYRTAFVKSLESTNNYFNTKYIIAQRIMLDNTIQKLLNHEAGVNVDLAEKTIERNLYIGLNRDFVDITNNSNMLLLSNRRYKNSLTESVLHNLADESTSNYYWHFSKDEFERSVVSIVLPIRSIIDSNRYKRIGFIKIEADYSYVQDTFSELDGLNNRIFLVGEDGVSLSVNSINNIVSIDTKWLNKKDSIISVIDRDNNSALLISKIEKTPWYLVSSYSFSEFSRQSMSLLKNNILYVIILFLLAIIISHIISIYLLKPLKKIGTLFNAYDVYGNAVEFPENNYISEVKELGISFNKMVERIENLFDELLISKIKNNTMEMEKKSAEITALQSQINPHFLYNALNNLIFVIKQNQIKKAVNIIKSLADFFRFGINQKDIIITIREEIKYTEAYANLISGVIKNDICFIWDIEPELYEFKTIKLILQPLVENAVLHGLKNKQGSGTIIVSCTDDNNNILFTVKDNGTGIKEADLYTMQSNLENCISSERIGLLNVQARIRLHYGEPYGIEIKSATGKGTCILVRIPKVNLNDIR